MEREWASARPADRTSRHSDSEMRNLRFAALLAAGALTLTSVLPSYAQMSDEAVIEYVKKGLAEGKSHNQIGKELLMKGATQAQAERIYSEYRNSREGANDGSSPEAAAHGEEDMTGIRPDSGYSDAAAGVLVRGEDDIFGHDIFRNRELTFEPNDNAATPENYLLGPGDELKIDIWGYNEASMTQTITPEGKIFISQVGPLYLSGVTIKEASDKISAALTSKYAGIGGEQPRTLVSVSLSRIRTINVNIMREVGTPGSYRLSSFATVFHSLYRAGGVTDRGTMRSIKVMRSGKPLATVDVYSYLFDGKSDSDIRLSDGDVVIVPPYGNLVSITGSVKRPMRYEMTDTESLATLLDYAGGFSSDAYREDVRVVRNTGAEREIFTVNAGDFGSFLMQDGDEVTVGTTLDRFANRVEIEGAVFRPGYYALGTVSTVKELVELAGGPVEDAYLGRATLKRERENLDLETVSIDLAGILGGSAPDVTLRKNDVLLVSAMSSIEDKGTLTINGYVSAPGTFDYRDNTTIEDLILMAGGLIDGASLARVDVARRVVDNGSVMPSDTIGRSYSFSLDRGLLDTGGEKFYLQPYDVVSVRKAPGYVNQRFVRVDGNVAFPGEYVLLNENERVSDIIRRAGGVTPKAYLHGGTLSRKTDEEVTSTNVKAMEIASMGSGKDSLDVRKLQIEERERIAIDLEEAVTIPGSESDIALLDGDIITIPDYIPTVRISGEVLYSNTVVYRSNKKLKDYINEAGGYGDMARKNKVYVVYMNGEVARSRNGRVRIEAGCEIIVPAKPERDKVSLQEILATSTTAASLTTMIATIFNLFR